MFVTLQLFVILQPDQCCRRFRIDRTMHLRYLSLCSVDSVTLNGYLRFIVDMNLNTLFVNMVLVLRNTLVDTGVFAAYAGNRVVGAFETFDGGAPFQFAGPEHIGLRVSVSVAYQGQTLALLDDLFGSLGLEDVDLGGLFDVIIWGGS
uniref:Uncharacterized protein n=1 Tax=Cacopsylla melanoneura TaxID=428564 RepID=A0A8D8T672_9HEMI